MRLYNDNELVKEFGEAGDWSNFSKIDLPFPMKIAWDKSKKINSTWCHKKIAKSLQYALKEILDHYGYERIVELRIDLFGGIFNYRKMRGSRTKWSRHSWAMAIDLDPERNALKTKAPKATFSQKEYKAMLDIFEMHGFLNYGRVKGFDWMHFEYAKR